MKGKYISFKSSKKIRRYSLSGFRLETVMPAISFCFLSIFRALVIRPNKRKEKSEEWMAIDPERIIAGGIWNAINLWRKWSLLSDRKLSGSKFKTTANF